MVRKLIQIALVIMLVMTLFGCDMERLPEGDRIDTIYFDDKVYAINIYWEYHCEEAEVKWVDDITVIINGHKLNVLKDTYDWREG